MQDMVVHSRSDQSKERRAEEARGKASHRAAFSLFIDPAKLIISHSKSGWPRLIVIKPVNNRHVDDSI
jgi:hypothetical protein